MAAGPYMAIEVTLDLAIVNALRARRYSRDHLYRHPAAYRLPGILAARQASGQWIRGSTGHGLRY